MDHTLYALPSDEIQSVLEKASLFGGRIAQPSSVAKAHSIIAKIDVVEKGMLLIKLPDEVQIEKSRPVSIKLNYRNISFSLSSNDYSIEGRTIIGHLPKSAKALALRDTERYAFPLDLKVSGIIHRVEKRSSTFNGEIQLIDLSRNGLGILLINAEPQTLVANDHIWIKSLNGQSLSSPIFGRVVYSFERKFKNTIDLKCGISLDSSIPEELFQELQQMCRLVLKA